MILHFDTAEVRALLDHTQAAAQHKALYDDPKTRKAGLWLVGDDGVYLISNGLPALQRPDDKDKHVVAYAEECHPTKLPFDDWWAAKRASFGGDDGCDFIGAEALSRSLATYRRGEKFALDVTSNGIGILDMTTAPTGRGRPRFGRTGPRAHAK